MKKVTFAKQVSSRQQLETLRWTEWLARGVQPGKYLILFIFKPGKYPTATIIFDGNGVRVKKSFNVHAFKDALKSLEWDVTKNLYVVVEDNDGLIFSLAVDEGSSGGGYEGYEKTSYGYKHKSLVRKVGDDFDIEF